MSLTCWNGSKLEVFIITQSYLPTDFADFYQHLRFCAYLGNFKVGKYSQMWALANDNHLFKTWQMKQFLKTVSVL